jgi:hypothetical protein
MRWVNRIMVLAAMLSVSAGAAVAQSAECTDDFKTSTYTKWYDNRQEKQDVAYQAANEFLTACPNEPADGPWAQQLKALKKFKDDYERIQNTKSVGTQFEAALKANNGAEVIRLGKQITSGAPDNVLVWIYMANTGLNDPNMLGEASPAAKKAIELIEGGKPFAPYKTKDLALASLTYIMAKASAKTTPIDSIPLFIKAIRYDSDVKKDAHIYNELAAAHGARVEKLTAEYQTFMGKPETTESKLVLANLNQAIDLQIDALARAAAFADAANKAALMERLTELYKFRYKSDTGMDKLLADVQTKPVPDVPAPITTLPEPSATPTPTPTGGTGGNTGGAAPGNSTTNGSNSRSLGPVNSGPAKTGTSTTSAPPAATAKPTATPKPKPRRLNHRGR